ncbi:MAG: UvrD-helicase domain-containing protein [Chitinophagales bacterium]
MSDSSNLILYKASAGSGKTYALTKEYLKIILLNPYDYNKILAVTFTRKATQEMKSRIIEELENLEKQEKKSKTIDLKNTIIKEIKQEKDIDITAFFDKNVSIALQLILHDYSNFNISTIDSFFQTIIRSFAKELDLPIGMEIELDTESVVQQAVQDMLKEYKTDKDPFSKWIEDFVFDLIDDDKSWKIEQQLIKLGNQLLNEEYQLLNENNNQDFDVETYKKVLVKLKKIIVQYKQKIDDLTKKVEHEIANNNLDLSQFYQGNRSIQSFINKTKNYEPEINSYLQKMLDGDDLYSKSKLKDTAVIQHLENAWNNYLQPFILAVIQHKETHQKKYIAAELVLKNIYSVALLAFINQKIKEYKAENNLVLISDTNRIVSVIAEHEEVPFIFEKSASFLKYILIDEFQDTSTLQWKGMLPLLLEILQNTDSLVLIVGDPKQSIYRWRGGKMELIINGIQSDLSFHTDKLRSITLKDNRRSAKEIIEFNNAFFLSVKNNISLENPLFAAVLEDVQQNVIKDAVGFVQCKWLPKPEENEDDTHLQEVLKIIRSLENTSKYSDIAILTRNNMHGAAVANYLQENNIPVVSAESLLLQNKLSIKLLIAALEYISHPKESFYAVKLNYLYAQFLEQENIESYLIQPKDEIYFFEEKVPFLNKENIAQLSSIAVNELVFLLINAFNLDHQTDSYIWRFQDIVLSHTAKKSTAIVDFLEFWNEQKEKLSILPPDGIDAVKIYTIHKSKGLQFPVVIVPYCDWKMSPKSRSLIWLQHEDEPFDALKTFPVEFSSKMENSLFEQAYNKEVEATYIDNINLLYVAFTRAEMQLYILSTAEKEAKDEALPQNVSRLLSAIIPSINLQNATIDVNEFTYGQKTNIVSEKEDSIKIKYMQLVDVQNFKEKIQLKRKVHYNDAQAKGTVLHAILANINQPDQLGKAMNMVALTESETAFYTDLSKKIIDLFEQKRWFDAKWQHFNERELLYKNQSLRADKILLSEDDCIVIDYKTGAKEKKYNKQLQEYMQVCATALQQKIQGYLLYVDDMELIEVNLN